MIKYLKKKFLTIFGDIKYYKWPFWFIYCPTSYAVKGEDYLEVSKLIEPGDIIIRGYSDYVDGLFIPGDYSHAGIYVGDNKIIHAVSEGVSYQNLIDFMRCDRILLLRSKNKLAIDHAIDFAIEAEQDNVQYDFDFNDLNNAYYCFELVVNAYKSLGIEKQRVKRFFGLYNKMMYIADSFIKSFALERIYEYNPRRGIKYIKL